ncbi:ATP phosphoribosyltransferase regulatory subunit [Acetobacteraceae bacterium KSS8]|uniref:ATP phosphoribosyltransferase regulatory subunit n=1 Tax=Endosaccharibacter trunci TaxID=2812733 RepID=A0ABT1W9S6_9PROT|nr:ATP phosphoribosyltransferase regulatory subunit [Acetobacteraceae bacterium KSS8]
MSDDTHPGTEEPNGFSRALLPAGLRDLLAPDAEIEAQGVETLMGVFSSHGYERVKPPLLEFEDSLLSGSGAAVAEQTFRLMDPDTHRMMGLRPDMTPQVARIAATRLVNAPRPLRLSYAGACVQVKGGSLSSDRQVSQAGIELLGEDSPEADAEIVAVGAEALSVLGLERISFDLTMPPLAPALIAEAGVAEAHRGALMRALDRKDAADVSRLGGRMAPILSELLLSAGPAARALEVLRAQPLPPGARALSDRLAETVSAIERAAPGLRLTIDPIEFRGWRYHTGVCVTVYAAGRHEELGRGGRYLGGNNEPACGLTLRTEALLRAAPPRPSRPRLLVTREADPALLARLRAEGFATVATAGAAGEAEARRLHCTHLLRGDAPVAL